MSSSKMFASKKSNTNNNPFLKNYNNTAPNRVVEPNKKYKAYTPYKKSSIFEFNLSDFPEVSISNTTIQKTPVITVDFTKINIVVEEKKEEEKIKEKEYIPKVFSEFPKPRQMPLHWRKEHLHGMKYDEYSDVDEEDEKDRWGRYEYVMRDFDSDVETDEELGSDLSEYDEM